MFSLSLSAFALHLTEHTIQPYSSIPSPMVIPAAIPTPEGSLLVSITTPQGSGDTEQSSLRTVPSISNVTERDLGRDFERLVDEVRTYDHARGLENQDIADNVRALRDELRGLADFLHASPPTTPMPVPMHMHMPMPVPVPVQQEPPRRGVQLTDRPVGGSTIMSPLYPAGPRVMEVHVHPEAGPRLSRATSAASSFVSYLSSHHSDEDLLEDVEETSMHSPAVWTHEEISSETPTSPISSSSTSSSSPSSGGSSTGTTIQQQAPDILGRALGDIQNQLRALEDGQTLTRDLLDALQNRPIPEPADHTPELAERLHRIEELIQNLLDRGHPQGPAPETQGPAPETVYNVPLSPTASISESTNSLDRLRSILNGLASPRGIDVPIAPQPVPAQAGPSTVQQLDDILSAAPNLASMRGLDLPRVVPFIYHPSERGTRARSTSPSSIATLPPRPPTVPLVFPMPPLRPRVVQRFGRPSGQVSEPDTAAQHIAPHREPPGDTASDILADRLRRRDTVQQQQGPPLRRPAPAPTPRPVIVSFQIRQSSFHILNFFLAKSV